MLTIHPDPTTAAPTHQRHRLLSVLGACLASLSLACTPARLGSSAETSPLTLTAWPPSIWLGVTDAAALAHYPIRSEVVARVHDAQGRPVDGAVVTFALAPDWTQRAELSPTQATTQRGVARAILALPQTTGLIPVTARTAEHTARATVLVETYEERLEKD